MFALLEPYDYKLSPIGAHTGLNNILFISKQKLQTIPSISAYFARLFINDWNQWKSWLTIIAGKQATVHQLTAMLSTCKNVLFPGHN